LSSIFNIFVNLVLINTTLNFLCLSPHQCLHDLVILWPILTPNAEYVFSVQFKFRVLYEHWNMQSFGYITNWSFQLFCGLSGSLLTVGLCLKRIFGIYPYFILSCSSHFVFVITSGVCNSVISLYHFQWGWLVKVTAYDMDKRGLILYGGGEI
jgi:hypothetical protein